MHTSKIIVACNAKIIEFVVSNLHLVITNMVMIMCSVANVRIKYADKIIVHYGKIFQCLGGFFLMKVWDIGVSDVDKVFNKIKVIVS